MKIKIFEPNGACPKCLFPNIQMFRQLADATHDVMLDNEVTKCNVRGEHLHVECVCGHVRILRPYDWKDPTEAKKKVAKKKVVKKGGNK